MKRQILHFISIARGRDDVRADLLSDDWKTTTRCRERWFVDAEIDGQVVAKDLWAKLAWITAEAETEAAPDAEGGGAGLALLLDKVAQVLRLRNPGQCLNL